MYAIKLNANCIRCIYLDFVRAVAPRIADADIVNFQRNDFAQRHHDLLREINIRRQWLRIVEMIERSASFIRHRDAPPLHITVYSEQAATEGNRINYHS